MSLSCLTISVSYFLTLYPSTNWVASLSIGLISQVAEELWEVANKTIRNLTKEDISIVDYKKNLVKQSESFP